MDTLARQLDEPQPARLEFGELMCPECGETFLHHVAVAVHVRESEDGPGQEIAVRRPRDVQIRSLAADAEEFGGRRDDILIAFWCEICGEDSRYHLQIRQHKGSTELCWV